MSFVELTLKHLFKCTSVGGLALHKQKPQSIAPAVPGSLRDLPVCSCTRWGYPRYCCSTAFGQLQGKKMRIPLIKEIKLPCMGWFSPQIRSGSHRSVDLWDPQGNVLVCPQPKSPFYVIPKV